MGTRGVRVSAIDFIVKLFKWDDLLMEIVSKNTHANVVKAAHALIEGRLVAFPTETVYGLGADASNLNAVKRIYEVKGRPSDHPLIIHISSVDRLDMWAMNIPNHALQLASKYWPGPMTLILERSKLAGDFVTGGQHKVGIRVPSHPVANSLLTEFEKIGGKGVAAPSANRFGAVSPTTAEAVVDEIGSALGINDIVIDGGLSEIGIESTIIDCTATIPCILRPGHVTAEMIEETLNSIKLQTPSQYNLKVSGNFDLHYSPRAQVILNELANPGEGFIAMSNIETPPGAIRLTSPKTLQEFAQNIYSALRSADHHKLQKISIIVPEGNGLAVALRDRLTKASNSKNIFYD